MLRFSFIYFLCVREILGKVVDLMLQVYVILFLTSIPPYLTFECLQNRLFQTHRTAHLKCKEEEAAECVLEELQLNKTGKIGPKDIAKVIFFQSYQ